MFINICSQKNSFYEGGSAMVKDLIIQFENDLNYIVFTFAI
jgi:hypothetical protein